MKRHYIKRLLLIFILCLALLITSCTTTRRPKTETDDFEGRVPTKDNQVQKPQLPKQLKAKENAEPRLKVFIEKENRVEEMAFEDYVAGVVGGEIKNDWPLEAIKAQAIIARTFVLRFIADKGHSSLNNEAHVSTSIEEAQAWNPEAINDNIKKAVEETRGQVIVHEGKFALTWFHSNAAGKTADSKEGLNYKEANPPYIQVVDSPDDSPDIPADEKQWTVSFTKEEVMKAAADAEQAIKSFNQIAIGEKGPSGRALNIVFDGKTKVSAPELRVALGSTKLKSTLLDSVALEGNKVVFKGKGYGHGVGMSQWGAYGFAKNKKSAEDIIKHYFKGTTIVKMWQ